MSFKRPFASRLRPVVLAVFLATSGLALADATTDQAKALIEQGQSQAAYDLLIPLESQRAGDETYDLLLGISAADIGRSTNAVFALERVLAVNPNNARARAEIARAYFALGEVKTAREEFETVKKQGIPAEVSKTIEKFLSAVDRLEDEGKTTIKSYVEASVGYDTNVNGGVGRSVIAVPGLGSLRLEGLNTEQSDSYVGVAAGTNVRVPLDARLAFVAGVAFNQRMNETWDEVDIGGWDGNVGLTLKEDKNVYSVSLLASTFSVDNDTYRDTLGVNAQWQHNYDQRNQATLFVQYADQRYPTSEGEFTDTDAQGNLVTNPRDADRWVAGVGFAHALRDFKTVFFGSVYGGYEEAKDQPNDGLDYDLMGLRFGGEHQYREDLSFFASFAYEERDYQGVYGGYGEDKDEETYYAGIGLVYKPAKNWKITPQYQYGHNHSLIDQYFTYTREVTSVTVRYEF